MALRKPAAILADKKLSQQWELITKDQQYTENDVPLLVLLCQWRVIADQAVRDMRDGDATHLSCDTEAGIKAMPQVAALKHASSEIRAICKQLGISDAESEIQLEKGKVTTLDIIQDNRRKRKAERTAKREDRPG